MEEPEYLPFSALSYEVVVKMSKPIIFTGAKVACQNLVAGAEEFHGRVKKQCASKKVGIGRVSDPLNTIQMEWMHQILGRVFHHGEVVKDQIITASNLPESLSSDKAVTASMTPVFWVSGPHHEATNFEPHMLGSIRLNVSGSRIFACCDVGLWAIFARKHLSPGGATADSAGWSSLASQSSTTTPLQTRQLFRNLNSDRPCYSN